MHRLIQKTNNKARRQARIRSKVSGTAERPRLSVFISATNVTAQIIDDNKSATIAYASTIGQKKLTGSMTAKAEWVGTEIAKSAQKAKVKHVVLDRNGRLYHGRIKALAEAARKEGLEF